MNWVLILVLTYSTEQIGPYASSKDCEKAFGVLQSQDHGPAVQVHYCVPIPNNTKIFWVDKLPEEFD